MHENIHKTRMEKVKMINYENKQIGKNNQTKSINRF